MQYDHFRFAIPEIFSHSFELVAALVFRSSQIYYFPGCWRLALQYAMQAQEKTPLVLQDQETIQEI